MGQGDMQHVDDRAPGQILDALVVLRGHGFRIDHPGSGDGGNRRLADVGLEIVLMDAGGQELQIRILLGQLMNGYYTPFFPGWDTHGLPIENAIQKSGVDRKSMQFKMIKCC